jgi:hypothetical protein
MSGDVIVGSQGFPLAGFEGTVSSCRRRLAASDSARRAGTALHHGVCTDGSHCGEYLWGEVCLYAGKVFLSLLSFC